MFSLVKGIYDLYSRKDEYCIIILGLDNAGKTTLLEKIKTTFSKGAGLTPDKIIPTIGMNIGKIDLQSCRLKFWDLGGQRDLQSIWTKYYAECHAIIFVIDASDFERLEEMRKTFSKTIMDDRLISVPILTLANKDDLPTAMKLYEIKEYLNPIAENLFARECKVISVSALTGHGINEAMDWLLSRLKLNSEAKPPNRVQD